MSSKFTRHWMQSVHKALKACGKCRNPNCKLRDKQGHSLSPAGCTVFNRTRSK